MHTREARLSDTPRSNQGSPVTSICSASQERANHSTCVLQCGRNTCPHGQAKFLVGQGVAASDLNQAWKEKLVKIIEEEEAGNACRLQPDSQ